MGNYTPRLFQNYNNEVSSKLRKILGIKNVMSTPKVEKIVLNMGLGDAKDNKTSMKQAIEEMTLIAGQKPVVTKSKKAISNFKIRIGDPVGVSVTLRKNMMYEFLDRFISVASPRIRDFRGFKGNGFDGQGNYNFGITEQIIFPEIDYDKVNSIRGLNITIVTSSSTDQGAYELLKCFGFPINDLKTKKRKLDKKNIDSSNIKGTEQKEINAKEDNKNIEEEIIKDESSSNIEENNASVKEDTKKIKRVK